MLCAVNHVIYSVEFGFSSRAAPNYEPDISFYTLTLIKRFLTSLYIFKHYNAIEPLVCFYYIQLRRGHKTVEDIYCEIVEQ